MRRTWSIVGSALFLVLAPGTVAVLVPYWISRWRFDGGLMAWLPLKVLGGLFIVIGAAGLLDSFARFALKGLGTPAPVFPTQHLVVSGLYRYVRNPMYVAVVSLIVGQSLLFGNIHLLEYGAIVWLVTHVFVLSYEEPTLRRAFGAEYDAFRVNVPRWIPRLTPWQQS
jgi:protein-S-isoprenylcysteine O-methyltransferase Ste14